MVLDWGVSTLLPVFLHLRQSHVHVTGPHHWPASTQVPSILGNACSWGYWESMKIGKNLREIHTCMEGYIHEHRIRTLAGGGDSCQWHAALVSTCLSCPKSGNSWPFWELPSTIAVSTDSTEHKATLESIKSSGIVLPGMADFTTSYSVFPIPHSGRD